HALNGVAWREQCVLRYAFMSSTIRGIVPSPIRMVEAEVGGVTNILKDAAELAFHLAESAEELPFAQAVGAPPCGTRGHTVRMIQAAPRSGASLPPPFIEPPQDSGVRLSSILVPP